MYRDIIKQVVAKAWRRLMLAVRFFTAKRVVGEASALTYSTMLAIVPIMAVVFAVARGFGYSKYIEVWFREAFSSQPAVADTIIGFVNSYLVHTKSGVFLGVGLVVMLYTVLMLVMTIESAFNGIWQVKKARSLFRTFTDYMAMLFLLPIAIVIMSGLSFFLTSVAHSMPYLHVVTPTVSLLINLLPYVIMSLLFIGLYVFVPNTHVRIYYCIVPGIMAGVAMQLLQLAYINSQIWVSSYNAIYGSFAALPLFMLWLQISWTICLFGAELCYTSQYFDYYDLNTTTRDISHRYKLMLCALMLSCICRRHDAGGRPYSAEDLRDMTHIPIRIVNDLLYEMQEANLVCEMTSDEKGEMPRFMPAMSPQHLSLGLMTDRLESLGQWKISLPAHLLKTEAWRKAISIRSDFLQMAKEVNLRDLWIEETK
ncbi:MAG: YihY/virulence factor BrkB family protein [Prevotella sp.]